MGDVEHTHLPGVGERRDFVTDQGQRIGVVAHRDGSRELVVYRREDPDSCEFVMRLSQPEAGDLIAMLSAD